MIPVVPIHLRLAAKVGRSKYYVFSFSAWTSLSKRKNSQPTGKCCSIRHMKFSEFQTWIFVRMESTRGSLWPRAFVSFLMFGNPDKTLSLVLEKCNLQLCRPVGNPVSFISQSTCMIFHTFTLFYFHNTYSSACRSLVICWLSASFPVVLGS